VRGYGADSGNIKLTYDLFESFLLMLRNDLKLDAVHLVAHSMGNRAIVEVLRRLAPAGEPYAREVVMAAPDVDADDIIQALPKLQGKASRYTLYGSSTDRAMSLSKAGRMQYPRAGDGGGNMLVVKGIESIDASKVGRDLFGFGHSYFSKKKSILWDIRDIIGRSLPPKDRPHLDPRVRDGLPYWLFSATKVV